MRLLQWIINKDLNGYDMGPLKEKAALFTFNTHTKDLYQISYMRLRKGTCFQDR